MAVKALRLKFSEFLHQNYIFVLRSLASSRCMDIQLRVAMKHFRTQSPSPRLSRFGENPRLLRLDIGNYAFGRNRTKKQKCAVYPQYLSDALSVVVKAQSGVILVAIDWFIYKNIIRNRARIEDFFLLLLLFLFTKGFRFENKIN